MVQYVDLQVDLHTQYATRHRLRRPTIQVCRYSAVENRSMCYDALFSYINTALGRLFHNKLGENYW